MVVAFRRRRLHHDAGVWLGDAGAIFLDLHVAVRRSFRGPVASATAQPSAPSASSLIASRPGRYSAGTSAVAAYGAFIAPVIIGQQITAGNAANGDVRLRCFLRLVPDPQLGGSTCAPVLKSRTRNSGLTLTTEVFHEPLSRPTQLFFANQGDVFPAITASPTGEDRTWEDAYRDRWAHDKIVRSTHGVNCTGSCSWKIYVKGGIVTWETQQTDYPRTRWGHAQSRTAGAARVVRAIAGICTAPNRVKIPDGARARLLKLWR